LSTDQVAIGVCLLVALVLLLLARWLLKWPDDEE
jgi:hypothetical protein